MGVEDGRVRSRSQSEKRFCQSLTWWTQKFLNRGKDIKHLGVRSLRLAVNKLMKNRREHKNHRAPIYFTSFLTWRATIPINKKHIAFEAEIQIIKVFHTEISEPTTLLTALSVYLLHRGSQKLVGLLDLGSWKQLALFPPFEKCLAVGSEWEAGRGQVADFKPQYSGHVKEAPLVLRAQSISACKAF